MPLTLKAPIVLGSAAGLPDWQVPKFEALPLLRKEAEAGNGEAIRRLVSILLACRSTEVKTVRQRIADVESEAAAVRSDKTLAAATAAEKLQHVPRALENLHLRIDGCDAVPADLRDRGLDWLQAAAEADMPDMKAQYVLTALTNYVHDPAAAIADIDEVLVRRDRARRYIAEGTRQCDPAMRSALFDAADWVFDADVVAHVAAMQSYYRAAQNTGSEAVHVRYTEQKVGYAAERLDADSRQRAFQIGDAAYARCQREFPR